MILVNVFQFLCHTDGDTDADTEMDAGPDSDAETDVDPSDAHVVIFIIDGMQSDTAATTAAIGADNLKMVMEQGITVGKAYSASPEPRLDLPDGQGQTSAEKRQGSESRARQEREAESDEKVLGSERFQEKQRDASEKLKT